jgi:hypothetical protein
MKNVNTSNNSYSFKQRKDTNIFPFLCSVSHLNTISKGLIIKLSQRFNISPDAMALLISTAVNGGANYEN